jgi:Holliday junction resolvasome RuvABC endonuclease subunit
MRVLAFDASSTTGWASFASARSRPVLGDFCIAASVNYGVIALDALQRVLALIDEHKPDVVALERPIFLPRDRWHTRRLLTCLAVAIEIAAAKRHVRCLEADPSEVKTALVGPRSRDDQASKDEMVVAAVNMGWSVANHHQADACGVALAIYSFLARAGA